MSKIVTSVFEIDTEIPNSSIKESLEKIISGSVFNAREFDLKIQKVVVDEKEEAESEERELSC